MAVVAEANAFGQFGTEFDIAHIVKHRADGKFFLLWLNVMSAEAGSRDFVAQNAPGGPEFIHNCLLPSLHAVVTGAIVGETPFSLRGVFLVCPPSLLTLTGHPLRVAPFSLSPPLPFGLASLSFAWVNLLSHHNAIMARGGQSQKFTEIYPAFLEARQNYGFTPPPSKGRGR